MQLAGFALVGAGVTLPPGWVGVGSGGQGVDGAGVGFHTPGHGVLELPVELLLVGGTVEFDEGAGEMTTGAEVTGTDGDGVTGTGDGDLVLIWSGFPACAHATLTAMSATTALMFMAIKGSGGK